jgi:hypothetical protein
LSFFLSVTIFMSHIVIKETISCTRVRFDP